MVRVQLTKSKAKEYNKASKKRKGVMLDTLCEDTGWSRGSARRQLKKCLLGTTKKKKKGKGRPKKYSATAQQILINAWALSGTSCGQYLHIQLEDGLLMRLIKNKELREGVKNSGAIVTEENSALGEILKMSSSTIDRYLTQARRALEPLSKATTKRANYALRNEIPFGKSYSKPLVPGYLSTDTVAHCGHSLKGDHLWTLNSTDVCSGWTQTVTINGRARKWIVGGHDEILADFPFAILGINYDGGTEFINREMIDYSKLHDYQMTRSRPYHSNDNAHVEQKNGDIVRRYAFRYRYEGKEILNLLNRLWYWVNLRKNYLLPTKKCIGHVKTKSGRTRGVYDKPKTPCRRLLESEAVAVKDKELLRKTLTRLNDAEVTRHINELQSLLLEYASGTDLAEYITEMTEVEPAA